MNFQQQKKAQNLKVSNSNSFYFIPLNSYYPTHPFSSLEYINPNRPCIAKIEKTEQNQCCNHNAQDPINRNNNGVNDDKQGE